MTGKEAYDRLQNCTSAAEVKALAAEAGVDVTDAQASALVGTGELDDAALVGVAGGFSFDKIPELLGDLFENLENIPAPEFLSKLFIII